MSGEKIRDNPNVVEVYSNRIIECSSDGAVFSIVLAKARQLVDRTGNVKQVGEPEAVINSRICISEQAAIELHALLGGVLSAVARRRSQTSADTKIIAN